MPGKGAFYYINHHNSGTFSGLPDSTAQQNDAMLKFFADSKHPIYGLSNEVSFIPKIL